MVLPNNIVDAVAAVRDGEFGFPQDVMIGDLIISSLVGLQPYEEQEITSKPLDAGYTMTDAAVTLPGELSLDIVLANPDFSPEAGVTAAITGGLSGFLDTWRDKKKDLYAKKSNKEILEVQTHDELYQSYMIASISPYYDVDENYDAFFANVILKEVVLLFGESSDGLLDSANEAVGGL